MSAEELRRIRGGKLAMIYQDPMSSLNPVMTIGGQLMEVPIIHQGANEAQARERALHMLAEVNLPDPQSVFERYPHQLSGGQQQRVVIAMALMAEPSLLVMDEPTTGLDVTVEAAVLDLVRALRRKHNSAIVFISHNLGTVVRICDRGDVFGRARGGGPDRRGLQGPPPPLHAGAARLHPRAGQRQALVASGADSRAGAAGAASAARVHLRVALHLCRSGPVHVGANPDRIGSRRRQPSRAVRAQPGIGATPARGSADTRTRRRARH
jgi:energy-coupling factor transporter ATP-binding protein EcfA2